MRETVRRRQPPAPAPQPKPHHTAAGLPNHALARRLSRRPAPVAGLPPMADGLTRFFDGAPRLKALAGRPAPAVDAKALDLAPAFDWLKELTDTLDLVEPIADPSMLVFESTLVEGHDGDYGHAETQMKTLLPATVAAAAPRARDLGTRVRDAVVAAMNDSSVIEHGPEANPNLPTKADAIKWREQATKLAALAPKVDKSGALKEAALALEDAALAILQARAVAEARTTWRAGTVNSSSAATPRRDELDDVFADSGYGGNKAFDKGGGALADWCGMFRRREPVPRLGARQADADGVRAHRQPPRLLHLHADRRQERRPHAAVDLGRRAVVVGRGLSRVARAQAQGRGGAGRGGRHPPGRHRADPPQRRQARPVAR
jgi:hypothetical protein